jgi:CheY-like chemotaxis protein/HPt (histidine-containing phosphotransfer) domain-containing protein
MSKLLTGGKLPAEERRHAEIIHSSTESLLNLIDELLVLSRIEAGRLELETEDFRLRQLVEESVELLKPRARAKRLDLRFSVADGTPDELSGDPRHLRQVFLHLIGNAVKFTRRGFVFVTVSQEEADARDGERYRIRFSVRDTGTGIAAERLSQIFEPFVKGESSDNWSYGGNGLGLSISQGLVELMGGELAVESTPGEGSTFTFAVPFAPAEDLAALAARPAAETAPPGTPREQRAKRRVLVAEDDEVNRMLALRVLTEAGFQADAVHNGLKALEALEERTYDLILMDCQMPELDGYEATRLIRQIEKGQRGAGYRHLPVIAVTALTMKGDRERCIDAGMDAFVAKPYRAEQLVAAVDRHLGLAEPPPAAAGPSPTRDGLPKGSLDSDAFRQLLDFSKSPQGGFLSSLVETFIRERTIRCDELAAALDAGEGRRLAKLSHKLISASGSVGAYRLAKLAGDLEISARENKLKACRSVLADLAAEYEKTEEALREVIDAER